MADGCGVLSAVHAVQWHVEPRNLGRGAGSEPSDFWVHQEEGMGRGLFDPSGIASAAADGL